MSDLAIRFYQLTIPELREYARENNINLSGARLKGDIIKRIVDYHLANRQSRSQLPRSTRQTPGRELTPSPSMRTLPYEMQYEIANV